MPRTATRSAETQSIISYAEDIVTEKTGTTCTTELTRSSRRFNPFRLAVRVGGETRVTFYATTPEDAAERFLSWVDRNNRRVLARTLYRPIYA